MISATPLEQVAACFGGVLTSSSLSDASDAKHIQSAAIHDAETFTRGKDKAAFPALVLHRGQAGFMGASWSLTRVAFPSSQSLVLPLL